MSKRGAEPMERKTIPVGYADRPDLVLREKKFRGRAMILELKIADRLDQMEDRCRTAVKQIEEQDYVKVLEDDGYTQILRYGVCILKKVGATWSWPLDFFSAQW